MLWKNKKRKHRVVELQPDEILLDVHNLPQFNTQQFEGRIERPIAKRALKSLLGVMIFLSLFFVGRLSVLQLARAAYYTQKSEQNSLDHIPLFANRGVIYDRNGIELAWNSVTDPTMPIVRDYIKKPGFANILGYVSYPTKDDKGKYWQTVTIGKDGIEKQFDEVLAGTNGTKLVETDVNNTILSESTIEEPEQGNNISLSIDTVVQEVLAQGIIKVAKQSGYTGGAGAVMDINTGELLAFTTFPEYDQSVLASGKDSTLINGYIHSNTRPFLNRMTEGLYTPGSIVKPFLALAALQENIIDPRATIVSTGTLKVLNPYNPKLFTVFKDNAAHGAVDMRKAIAVSSNIYFYQIGGGYGKLQGLGIANIEKYAKLFGIGEKTGITVSGEREGSIPSITWKKKHFPGDPWRVGDTYNTSIGQYGFQVTPIQMLRAVASVASRGKIVTPTILKSIDSKPLSVATLPFNDAQYSVIHEAMRMVVTEGTAQTLNNPTILVAGKTGTAQIKNNTRVNSWAIGFFPYDRPRYAFVTLMEDGPRVSVGATHAFKPVLDVFVAHPQLLTQ